MTSEWLVNDSLPTLTYLLGLLFLTGSARESYPSSCVGLENGVQQLRFIDDTNYPVVNVKCVDGFAILDYNYDGLLKSYFSSWDKWFLYTAGPTNTDIVNWQDWFLPSRSSTSAGFLISEDCVSCDQTSGFNLQYTTSSTYWMSGSIFGCSASIRGQHNCDIDYETYTCYSCDGNFITDGGATRIELTAENYKTYYENDDYDSLEMNGICPKTINSATYTVSTSHDRCVDNSIGATTTLKPSIGISGSECVCYIPETKYIDNIQETDRVGTLKSILPEDDSSSSESTSEDYNIDTIIELFSDDFDAGTYRITHSGTYKIMENIIFNFNGAGTDILNYEYNLQKYWVPLESQADDYPGAGGYKNAFFMGFFAGITVECDDVIIDLNDHKIEMSDLFYIQQRWFVGIELSSQLFFPGQGIGHFGPSPHSSSNVLVKNGIIGLTSHHGIHGNYNNDITISNIRIFGFETHGIQLNGFNNLVIEDCEIGPTSTKAKLNGEYGHWRFILPRLRSIANEVGDDRLKFKGKAMTSLSDIGDTIEGYMNIAFNYVAFEEQYEDEPEELAMAKSLFVSDSGIPYASAQYGIFLNTFGASVFTYNLYNSYFSTNAVLTNIKIHGLEHKMDEYVRFHGNGEQTGNIYVNPFNGGFDASALVGEDIINDLDLELLRNGKIKYKGNILTDGLLGMDLLSDNWNYLQIQVTMQEKLLNWAFGLPYDLSSMAMGCNGDVMLHSGKGTQGIRLDGVDTITISNVEIYDINDYTPLGSDACGSYDSLDVMNDDKGGHFRQTLPMQTGFSGNMNQGININAAKSVILENIYVHDLNSANGPVFGISVWPSADVTLKGDISIYNLNAGTDLEEGTFTYYDRPNYAPEVCGIRLYEEYSETTDDETISYTSSIDTSQTDSINTCNLSGHVSCFNVDNQNTMFGDYSSSEDDCNAIELSLTYSDTVENSIKYGNPEIDVDSAKRKHKNKKNKSSKSFIIPTILIIIVCISLLSIIFYKTYKNYNKISKGNYEYTSLNQKASNYGSV